MEELRKELDRIDVEVMRLLERRMEVCRELGRIKKAKGIEAYQPEQYRRHLEMLKGASSLDEGFVGRIYDVIHDEALRLQRE